MTTNMRRLRLRYQPSSDVLTGQIEPPEASTISGTEISERPDADLSLSWRATSEGPQLARFHLLHASHRLASRNVDHLAPSVLNAATTFIDRIRLDDSVTTTEESPGRHHTVRARADRFPSLDDTDLMAQAIAELSHASDIRVDRPFHELMSRSEVAIEVPSSDLRRRTAAVDPSELDATAARRVGNAVSRLAAALERQPIPSHPLEAHRLTSLIFALQELAGALETSNGLTAPGASAAARESVRGGLPFTRNEQQALKSALSDLDDRRRWAEAVDALDLISQSLH
jgi:hypothetical protein